MNDPKVSIIIPVYNGSNYVREAIDSALGQTYSNLEVIVVNDGSNDENATRDIALSYGERIRYFEKENGGVSSALNLGIREMTGEFFSWLSHDDKYEKDKIRNSVSYLKSFAEPENLIVMCSGYYINSASEKIRNMKMDFQRDVVYDGKAVLKYLLTHGILDACCLLIPRAAFEKCGYFDEKLRYNQDALMLYSLFGNGYSLAVEPEQHNVMYRLHANQTSKTRRDLLLRDSYRLSKIIAPLFASLSSKSSNYLRMFAIRQARANCMNAVNESIEVGKRTRTLETVDLLYIWCWCVFGKLRDGLKKLYYKLCFR